MSSGIEVTIKDNSKQVLSELETKIKIAMAAIGMDAEGYAKRGCPVDTGRLRNSITYATSEYEGQKVYTDDENHTFADGGAQATPEPGVVYIGTNVEYAAAVEYRDGVQHTTGGAHFLKNAAANHGKEYQEKVKKILQD